MDLWPKDLEGARRVQKLLKERVRLVPLRSPKYVCGVDASYSGQFIYCCASVFTFPELVPVEDAFFGTTVEFPYVPSFLGFREGKALVEALRRLKRRPDVVILDGHGLAHPSLFGIASQVGVVLEVPTIGCAKENLVGTYVEPERPAGSYSPIVYEGRIVGAALRTRCNTRPIFVSPGHLSDLASALSLIVRCTKGFRLPEPIRRAHHLSKMYRRSAQTVSS